MASASPSQKMQEDATCSICLEYLTEPVTIDCGHNFCRACITQYSEHGEPVSGTTFPCPECRMPFEKRKFRSNRKLANIVDNIKQLRLKPGKGQKENLCEQHQEKLKLFCEEDGKAICVVCRESRDHRDHTTLPVEEAAHDYKVKLQAALGPLLMELEEALALTSEEEKKSIEWQGKVENRRQSITREFKKLHQVLSEEEQLLLRRLAAEERETLQRLQDNITKLSEQSTTLINLITALQEKCQQPAAELLQDVKSTLIRSEHVKLQPPQVVSPALRNGYKICLDMRGMLERFTVDVTLDPDTANRWLVLSEDRKRVRHGDTRQDLPDNPERFETSACVLGAGGFTGGWSYWEVEVGDKPEWALGVCRESVSRRGKVTASPKHGYWTLCLRGGVYKALTSPPTTLPVSVRPSRVGVFLDYGAGEVSFYNVTDRSHLFTFTDTFSGTLRPCFYPGYSAGGTNAAPLIICPVPAQAGGNFCPVQ
ncbi:E3 ubiquitin-protein ligase TRIM39-like [Malaclemys terrapin pileata]|uniref:E3 ubiquitin-protein ligase TRIM39-like n=1 Tax=Malaclemys terrapin pileata TaxID=2991368 RepID=UPI0023A7A1C9|nr:E3 ubiquitin-protein ligase TRIM39-like [Malaclemys terrapin pileata]